MKNSILQLEQSIVDKVQAMIQAGDIKRDTAIKQQTDALEATIAQIKPGTSLEGLNALTTQVADLVKAVGASDGASQVEFNGLKSELADIREFLSKFSDAIYENMGGLHRKMNASLDASESFRKKYDRDTETTHEMLGTIQQTLQNVQSGVDFIKLLVCLIISILCFLCTRNILLFMFSHATILQRQWRNVTK